MIKTALVGFGWWGQYISQKLIISNKFKLKYIIENDQRKYQQIKKLGLEPFTNLDEVLLDNSIEAVLLTSPNHLHDEQVLKCALRGKHVFCEKPLSLTVEGARSSFEICKKNGLILGIGHERRFEPAIKMIKNFIDKETLGTIMHAEMAFSHDKLINVPANSWRQSSSKAPAAGMTQMGIHLTDLLIWMFGKVRSVQAIKANRSLDWETGDTITAQLSFERGMTATFQSILHTPFFLRTHIFGSKKWIEIRNSQHPDSPDGVANMDISVSGKKLKNKKFKWEDTVMLNLNEFANAIRGKSIYPFSKFEIIHNIEVLEAIINSSNSQSTINI